MIKHRSLLLWLSLVSFSACWGQEEGTRVRVASISFEPTKLDLPGNTKKLSKLFREASAGGAKIAVAPEGSLDGYIVNEILAGTIEARQMRDVAVDINSSTIKHFQELARDLDMCLVFGFAERIQDDVYNSAVFIDQRGQIRGKYHKMQFHEGYDAAWWFNRLGKQSRAFDTPYGRCGVLICNDRWNPLLAKIPALDGAQFLVIPSFGSTSKQQDDAVISRGVETALPIIEANVGVSLVVSEQAVAAVGREREGMVFAEIVIPPKRAPRVDARDQAEAEFLAWRGMEMPKRLRDYRAALEPRGPARNEDVASLKSDALELVVGNNRSLEAKGHRAGYNGIFSIRSREQQESPFVPAYAGWNLEHYFDGSPRGDAEVFFEPRHAPMKLRRIDARTVELYQPSTPTFQVESWSQFRLHDHHVDFTFRCRPRRDDYVGDFLGVFWASYINGPLDKSMYFIDAGSQLRKPLWRQLCTQQHNLNSTVRSAHDDTRLSFLTDDTLFSNDSPLRYSAPFFYGRFRNMVLIYVFRPDDHLRFTHSPSGGGRSRLGDDTNPAWDFQLIIPEPQVDQDYILEGRLIYKLWQDRADVLAQVKKYLEAARDGDRGPACR